MAELPGPDPAKRAQNDAMLASAREHVPAGWTPGWQVRVPLVCECRDATCHRLVTVPLAALDSPTDRPPLLDPHCCRG